MSTLTDLLKAGPNKPSNGTRSAIEIWLENLTDEDRQAFITAANNTAWSTAELFRIAKSNGLPVQVNQMRVWRTRLNEPR
jgi:hypothetical protein